MLLEQCARAAGVAPEKLISRYTVKFKGMNLEKMHGQLSTEIKKVTDLMGEFKGMVVRDQTVAKPFHDVPEDIDKDREAEAFINSKIGKIVEVEEEESN